MDRYFFPIVSTKIGKFRLIDLSRSKSLSHEEIAHICHIESDHDGSLFFAYSTSSPDRSEDKEHDRCKGSESKVEIGCHSEWNRSDDCGHTEDDEDIHDIGYHDIPEFYIGVSSFCSDDRGDELLGRCPNGYDRETDHCLRYTDHLCELYCSIDESLPSDKKYSYTS